MKSSPSRRAIVLRTAINLIAVAVLLVVMFSYVLFGPWKMSFTSMNYDFAPFASSGVATKGPILSDPADNVIPIAYETFHGFHFTAWLANAGIGAAQLMSMYLSPLNYFYLLPMAVAMPAIAVTKVVVAFVAMYLFVRQIGAGWKGALISGLSYCASSVMVVWLGWPHSEVMMYGPFLFLLLDKALQCPRVRYYAWIAVVVFLMMVAGMPTFAAYFLYLAGIYAVCYGIRRYWRQWKNFAKYLGCSLAAVVVGGLMSFPYTGQILGSVGSNGYADSREAQATWSLPLRQLKSLLFPYLSTSQDLHFNEITLYTGILAAVSLPLVVVHWRRKKGSVFFSVAVVVLLTLIFTSFLTPLFTHLPLVNTSKKYRVIVLLNFSLSVLAGVNIGDLLDGAFSDMRERITVWAAAGLGAVVYGVMLWRVWPTRDAAPYGAYQPLIAAGVVAVYLVVIIVRTCGVPKIAMSKIVASVCAMVLALGAAIDGGYFAANYLPLIQKDASVIPAATDSVKYLQRNTKYQEKITTVGDWMFFPLTNMPYGIRNIFGHGFSYTDPDVMAYYKRIDPTMYGSGVMSESSKSQTRPTLTSIRNENMLRYLGVKYVVSDINNVQDRKPIAGTGVPVGPLGNGAKMEQEFTARYDGLDAVSVLLGTGGATYAKSSTITATISDAATGKTKAISSLPLRSLRDNDWARFEFSPISGSRNGRYVLSLSVQGQENESVSVYTSSEDNYAGDGTLVHGGNSEREAIGDVVFRGHYTRDGRIGDDGLNVRQIAQFSDQVQLTDTVKVLNTNDEVLDAMADAYEAHTVFFSKETGSPANVSTSKQTLLGADERVTNIRHGDDGSITFDTSLRADRYVLVNEYNDDNWVASVDGSSVEVYKGNALFRAVKVPAGKHTVVLRYQSTSLRRLFFVGLTGLAMLVLAICLSKFIDPCLIPADERY